jgi:gas vesicle protein
MTAISVTKLYDLLSVKLGRETAEYLTTFIETKINQGLESKIGILTTKEDLAKFTISSNENFAKFTLAIKEDLVKFKEETKEDLSRLKLDVAGLDSKIKESKGETIPTRIMRRI